MTQSEMILRHLQEDGSITPFDALREYGCMRLGARIYDLRRKGHRISAATESCVNRFGKRVTYVRYTMGER